MMARTELYFHKVGDDLNFTNDQVSRKFQRTTPLFSDLRNQPLGSIPSIIFWSKDQLKTLYDLETNPHTLIQVDKCVDL